MKRLCCLICVGLTLFLVCFTATSNSPAYARSLSTASQAPGAVTLSTTTLPGQQIDPSQQYKLAVQSYQLAVQQVMHKAGVTDPTTVQANQSYRCQIITFNSASGSLCITLYAVCVGPVCAPYAVALDFSQTLLDRLATSTAAAAAFITSLVNAWFPPLGPFAGVISSFLAYAFISLDNYGRNSCGGRGAGIYINFTPPWFSFHCS